MRITIDISQAQYIGTGVGTYTLELAKHMSALASDHQLNFFGVSKGNYSYLKQTFSPLGPTKILPLPTNIWEKMANQMHFIPIEMFAGSTDIFHSSDWTEPKARNARKVTTIHDLTVLLYPKHQHPEIVATHKRRLAWVSKESDAIIADSENTKQDIVRLLKIDDKKIHVVYLAASPQFGQLARSKKAQYELAVKKVRQKYHLNKKYMLSVGTQEPRKNLAKTIQAFLHFAPNPDSEYELVVVGKYGWGEGLPKNQLPHVKLLGFVPGEDLPALYAGSEIFLYPSLYEGFGLPVLEAMSLGVPVITTKRGSLSEVAGSAGVLVDPESVISISNGIHRALARQNDLEQLSLAQAKKFSWDKTAVETLQVYEKVLT